MPRVKDIAWKFVTRLEGEKWCCPYCETKYSGKVTRVRSHFLKHSNKGISPCKKVPEHISMLMDWLHNQVRHKEDIAWKFVDRLEDNKWRCHHCTEEFSGDLTGVKGHLLEVPNEGISICTQVPEHVRTLMRSLLDEVAEEESREVAEEQSREAHGQSSVEPKSRDMPTHSQQAGVAEEEIRGANCQLSTEPESRDMPPRAGLLSPQSLEFVEHLLQTPEGETLATPSPAQNSHGESSTIVSTEEVPNSHNLLYQPRCYIQSQMQVNAQQTPAGASSFQDDQLPGVDNLDCLQDCNQHSQLPTLMDIDPSIAPQHTSDSHVIEATMLDLQVQEAATNTTGPSSSQDMNRGSPIMEVRNIHANDKEIRNLKRKVEKLYDKEAVIKGQMAIESAASSVQKKPREVEELREQALPQTQHIEGRDAKGVKFLERKLTGEAIHQNIKLIWDCLKENHACKLGICGMGGVGKTTIMMHIYNKLIKDATFDGVVFITVSQEFSIYKLQSDIWKALKLGIMEDEHEKKRAVMLSEQLERKKNCVLILDDVWQRLDLEEVGIPVRADGFKLVLTTRSYDVCRQMQCQQKIKIKPMSQKEAESLFLEELGSKVSLNLEIEEIVESIVKECAGLPIGVITMARSMRGVTNVFEWRDSLVKLKESSIGQTDMEKKVLMNLKFSYDRLDHPNVQQCFLSCALYPEDKAIGKSEFIEFFIDQGLIGGLNTMKEQYDRGLAILEMLENVCLLEKNWFGMKMHDLLRDMALHIMSATSMVKSGKGLKRIPSEEYWTDALEKVSLMENNISEFPLNLSPNCPKLSTLLLNRCFLGNVAIPNSFFKNLLGLKVLNLSRNIMIELPNSISDLVNLRVLLLRNCPKLCRIPYLGKLTSLKKLDTSYCERLEALEGLEKLVNLRYLDMTGTCIERLPQGTLNYSYLQCLKVSAVVEDYITKLGALEKFECHLKYVDDFNKCVRIIEQGDYPHNYNYNINAALEKPAFIAKLNDDTQSGYMKRRDNIEEWVFGILKSVNITGWGHAIVSVGGECTGIFILIPRDVWTLTMTICNGITNLSSMGPLEYLKMLDIRECENLGVLRGGQDEDEEVIGIPAPTPAPLPPSLFPNLRTLKIRGCPKLKYLFGHESKSNIPHLREITIYKCEEMVGIIAAITSPPPNPLPYFPSLEEISVESCGEMKRAVESEWMPHFPALRRIKVFNCEKMKEIIGRPSPYLPVEEISLESLTVEYCHNMRKLFPHEWLLQLQNLQSIHVAYCKGMVEMISGAGQCQEGSIMTPVNNTSSSFQPSSISLPQLELLDLHDLPQLKSICKVRISCDSMEDLRVWNCPKLKGIPLQLQLRDIEKLPYILVEDEERWKTLMWDLPNAHAILQNHLKRGQYVYPNLIELDT